MAHAALDAAIAAIDVYNKPDFRYREEAFAILMVNSWELLLKAKILRENNNSNKSIYVFTNKTKSDGSPGKKKILRRNRSGNPTTIDIRRAAYLTAQYPDGIDDRCIANLDSIIEIRDNSVHFINREAGLAQRVQEIGTASLKNFLHSAQEWFGIDISKYNFYLMPIYFHHPHDFKSAIEAGNFNSETSRLLAYIGEQENKFPTDTAKNYNVSLNVELRFVKSKAEGAVPVKLSKEDDAQPVYLEEESIKEKYPYDYSSLIARIKKNIDFKQNQEFHKIKNELERNNNYCFERRLDPDNPKSSKKKYYSEAMAQQLIKKLRFSGLATKK